MFYKRLNKNKQVGSFGKRWYLFQKSCHESIGFTFIELIIVVTIIAILSISAWSALSGETGKARDARRQMDLSKIQEALLSYYNKNNFYPQPAPRDEENQKYAWGYREGNQSLASCVTKYDTGLDDIDFEGTYCGGDIYDLENEIIGWKGVLNENAGRNSVAVIKDREDLQAAFGIKYIDKVPADPRLSTREDLFTKGVGEYVYSVYRGVMAGRDYRNGGFQYQLAATLEGDSPDEMKTIIVGNYTQKRGPRIDPHSLIGSSKNVLLDGQKIGQDNEKVTQKDLSGQEADLRGEVGVLKENVDEWIIAIGDVSDSAVDHLEDISERIAIIEEETLNRDFLKDKTDSEREVIFEDVAFTLRDIREDIQRALGELYLVSADLIYKSIKEALDNDQTDDVRKQVLSKIKNIKSVITALERTARKTRFKSLRDEINTRKAIDKQMELLVEEELKDLLDILEEGAESGALNFPYDLEEFYVERTFSDYNNPYSDTNGNGFDSSSGDGSEGPFKDIIILVEKFIEDALDVHSKLTEVDVDSDTDKKKFAHEFSKIKLKIGNFEDNIKDIERKTKDVKVPALSKRDLDRLFDEMKREPNPRRALELVLEAERKYTGKENPLNIYIGYAESALDVTGDQPGVAIDPFNSESSYSGIPYPLEIGG